MEGLGSLKGYVRGVSYILVWYTSILLGFIFLYAPLLPFVFIHRPTFRKGTDTLIATWEAFNTSLLQLVYGVDIVLTGDTLNELDDALILLNHPTRTDWNFAWACLFHAGRAHNTKIVLKEELRTIPGLGWVMAMGRFIYLKRKWSEDSVRLDRWMDHYNSTRTEGPRQILLFPEGTNLSPNTIAKSNQFAEKKNLAKYKHVLHPRTGGFVHLAHGLQERRLLGAVYDFTIAYTGNIPTSEMDLIKGGPPQRVHIHIVRYPLNKVPTTYVGLEKWMEELWREKEKLLDHFHQTKEFIPISQDQRIPCRIKTLQPMCLLVWSLFLAWAVYSIIFTTWAKIFVFVVSATFTISEGYTRGIQELEINLESGHWGLGRLLGYNSNNKDVQENQDDFEHLKDD